MQILHLTSSRFFGGPERQMLELAKTLRPGCQTTFVSFSEEGLCRDFLGRAQQEGFPTRELRADTPWLLSALRELVHLFRSERPDVIFCHGYKAGLLGLVAARRVSRPAIAVSRGWTGETFRVRLYDALDRIVLRYMDAVVCVSHGQARKVRRAGVPQRKLSVIWNAIRCNRFDQPQQEYRRRLEQLFPEPPTTIVGSAGRLSPEKGFDVLVDAAAEVVGKNPEVGFALFGDGAQRDALTRRIAERRLEHRFVLAGFSPEFDRFLPYLDVLALSSYSEGLPNVILEAFAAGVPVVTTAVGGTPEIVEHGENGYLVPAGDPQSLAEGILDIAADGPRRLQMGRSGRQRVEQRFSFDSQARSYTDLVRRMADGRRHDRGATRRVKRPYADATAVDGRTTRRRPVNICFMIDNLGLAGAETQLLMLINSIDRTRARPLLCLLDGDHELSYSLAPPDCPILRLGIKSLRHPSSIERAWQLARFLRQNEVDVFQAKLPDSTYFGVPIARLAGVKAVVATSENIGYWMRPRDRSLGRVLSRIVDATISNCEACRQAAIRLEGRPPRSVVVLHNGIDMDPLLDIPPPSTTIDHSPVIGIVANIRPVKAPDVFIRAASIVARSHPRARFEMAGKGDEEQALRLANELGIPDRLVLRGSVADIPGFLATVDVAVLTSHSEGLSNAVIEYMAAARPIVATAVGGNVELLEDGVHGLLVPPDNPEAVAAAIDRLLQDRSLAAAMGRAARGRAQGATTAQ